MPLSSLIASPASRTVRVAGALTSLAAVAFAALLPVSIAGMQIAWWVAGLGVLALMAAGERYRPTALAAPLALHAATLALSLVFAAWPGREQEAWDLWRLLAIPVLAFALTRDRRATRHALAGLLVVAALVAPYAIAQYFTGIDWLRVTDKTVRFAAAFAEGRYRPVGAYNAYPTFAFVYTAVGLVAVAAAVAHRGRLRPWLWAAAVLLIGAALFAQVRAAWMAGAAGLLTVGWLHSRRAVLRAAVAVVLVGGLMVAAIPSLRAKAVATADLSYANNRDRIFMWARALEMVSDHPVTGIGHGSWTPATDWYFDRWDAQQEVRCHAHDNFLHFWATTGPFGLMAFVWLLLAHLRQSARAFRRSRSSDPLAATLALSGAAVAVGFVAYALTQDPYFDGEVFYTFALALAFGAAAARWTRTVPSPRLSGHTATGVAVPTLAGLLASAATLPALATPGGLSVGRFAVPLAIAFGLAVVSVDRRLLARLARDGYTRAVAVTAALVLGLPLVVLYGLAPAAGLEHAAAPAGGLVAAIGLGTALAARTFFVARPRPGGAVAGVSALLVAGLLGQAIYGDAPDAPAPAAGLAIPSDVDGDGVPDADDGCMRWDPSQTDTDGDGVGDACEPLLDALQTPGGVLAVTGNGWLVRLDRSRTADGAIEARSHPVRRFSADDDWAALVQGRFDAERAPVLALASYWGRELRWVDEAGRTLDREPRGPTRWSGLAALPAEGEDLLMAVGHGRPGVVVWSGVGAARKRRAALASAADYDALALVDVDGDGGPEPVAARGGKRGPWALDVLAVEGDAIVVRDTLPLAYPVSDLVAVVTPAGPRLVAVGRWGRVEVFRPDEGGRLTSAGFRMVDGGLRWALPVEGGLLAYRRNDPVFLSLELP